MFKPIFNYQGKDPTFRQLRWKILILKSREVFAKENLKPTNIVIVYIYIQIWHWYFDSEITD